MELKILHPHENKAAPLFASPECQQLLTMYEEYYPKIGFVPPWVGYLVMRQQQVVGMGSFVGAPQHGQVELAYWTFPTFEGQGVASFACGALLAIAQATDPTLVVVAKTAPEPNASTRILAKHGFRYSHVVQDEEIGDAWLWTLEPAARIVVNGENK